MNTGKSKEEIEKIRESALIVSKTLGMLASEIKPGVTSNHLDNLAYEFIKDNGARPGFLGLYDFPNTLCVSPNSQVVHGIPNDIPLKNGDILSVDCGVFKNGYYGDHAFTFPVGEIDEMLKKLLKTTIECLYIGIAEFKVGKRTGDMGYAIQEHAEKNGFGVVRELVGHGIGEQMHEEPKLPNYGKKGRGKKFYEGLVGAIEPMINLGTAKIRQLDDGWTIVTRDGLQSAHFEHNVAIVDGKPEILSTFDFVFESLKTTFVDEDFLICKI